MFKGSIVALITPMQEDGSIDEKTLCELIEWHIAAKTDAIIVTGTTGEAPTLDSTEQARVITVSVKQAAKRIPIIAGTGTNSTNTTLTLSQNAKAAGADACLIVTPYYNKPSQNGLYQHYKFIAENISLPILLYNVPGRTGCDLLADTVCELAKIENIFGIKECTGTPERAKEIRERCGKNFAIYSGDDAIGLGMILNGGDGIVSVTANIAPEKMARMCAAALQGDKITAEKINAELMLLHKLLFVETNPVPTKWALHTLGKIQNGIRMPLLPLDSKYQHDVKEAMKNAGVL